MARNEAPPFPRGEYVDATEFAHLEGVEYVFEDIDYSSQGVKSARTNRQVVCRVMNNQSGIALLPKRVLGLEALAGKYGSRSKGYTTTTAEKGFGVDEFLPSSGVPTDNLFWGVVKGPTVVKTSLSNMTASVAVGDPVVAITAATSQATTAGRINSQVLAVTEAALANAVRNAIGRALTARTSNETDADILVDVGVL